MVQSIFKAYDIRGYYPEEINARTVEEIATALGRHFPAGSIVLGHDGRTSSPALAFATARGLALTRPRSAVVDIGVCTTPMFYFLVNNLRAAGGVMVTASHNPRAMNGLKVVGRGAVPLSGTDVKKLMHRPHASA